MTVPLKEIEKAREIMLKEHVDTILEWAGCRSLGEWARKVEERRTGLKLPKRPSELRQEALDRGEPDPIR